MDHSSLLVMPCLGRPFKLGMLYDCRGDQIIPGETLWDSNHLEQSVEKSQLPETEFHVLTKDTISEKMRSLKIFSNLKLNALAGTLLNVSTAIADPKTKLE